jgi:hypothetical protein
MNKLLLLLLIVPVLGFGQISATVDENGKKVLLNSDGTWSYKSQNNVQFEGTGIWKIGYFVDEFGDPTENGYISNSNYISGVFSNSATSNSNLNSLFLISKKSRVALQLYEYAGRNPVKAYSTKDYSIIVKDGSGEKHSMKGTMYEGGDRIFFDRSSGKNHISKMHNILMNGGNITVVLKDTEYGLSTYKIQFNADGYKNASNAMLN